MQKDGALGHIERNLDKVSRDGKEAYRLTCVRLYDTGVEDAWDALTNPERIPRWFLPISGDLKVGGRYKFEGNAGGVIEKCEPPRLLGVTWEMHGGVSWVTVTLEPSGEKTRLTLEHVAHVPEELFDQYGPGAVGIGWDLALDCGLAIHFKTNAAVDPAAAQAWTLSPEGRAYVENAAAAWAEASIRVGILREKAEAAAANVSDFYSPKSTG